MTQYDSLCCILNEKGQVVAWQLTKGTSFNQVETLLKGLKSRLYKQGVVLKAVYVDNCCQVRQKVQNVFGNVPVKLDLHYSMPFHELHKKYLSSQGISLLVLASLTFQMCFDARVTKKKNGRKKPRALKSSWTI